MPVMSAGVRSGVNWTRLNLSSSASERVEMSRVFARPETPTRRACPRQKIAMSVCLLDDFVLADDYAAHLFLHFCINLLQFAQLLADLRSP